MRHTLRSPFDGAQDEREGDAIAAHAEALEA